jgi:RNA polymerase sigma-B factor
MDRGMTPDQPASARRGGEQPPAGGAQVEDPSDATLFERMRSEGDQRAREHLIERYLPLARRLARRYQRTEEPMDDLVQVASLGLIKAVDRFDASREILFSSYAVPTILGELKRHFRDRTWSVRVPRDLQELAMRIDHVVTAISADTGRAPAVAEIARAVDASEERVLDAMEAAGAYHAGSLDAPRGSRQGEDSNETVADSLGENESGFDRAEDRATLEPLMAHISERERLVLHLRFGEGMTQAEIGAQIGVSQMQVSRLIRQSLARLRAGLEDRPSG